MSLSKCLRKAGEAIAREDKVAILAKAKELRESGLENQTAARRAVQAIMGEAKATLDGMAEKLGLNPKPAKPAFSRKEDKPFYSALARGIEGINAKSQPAEGWRAQIQGLINKGAIKADEVEWSGLGDWLKLKSGKVSKQEVQDFIAANGVQVHEVTKGAGLKLEDVRSQYVQAMVRQGAKPSEADQMFREMKAFSEDAHSYDEALKDKGYELIMRDGSVSGNELHDVTGGGDGNDTKFGTGSLVLPGGEHYREVLLTLPDRKPEPLTKLPDDYSVSINRWLQPENGSYTIIPPGQMHGAPFAGVHHTEEAARAAALERLNYNRAADKRGQFTESHWDEPNVLAHIRLNDRTDANGKKVLFVEEVQSDWGQKGRKKGFREDNEKRMQELIAKRDSLTDDAQAEAVQREINELGARDPGVVKGPFVDKTDAWLSLSLKRVIKMAADEGYDRVAFVGGRDSADRYDLSKQVDNISYEPTAKGFYINVIANGRNVKNGDFTARELEDIVGKDVVQKMVDGEGKPEGNPGAPDYEDLKGIKRLSGDGLKVGGTGMVKFYDQIVPAALNKLLPKFGGDKAANVDIAHPVTDYQRTARYVGPAHTFQDVAKLYEVSKRLRGDVYDNPLTGRREEYPINRVSNEQDLHELMAQMRKGKPFAEAIVHPEMGGSVAQLFGGKIERFEPEPESKSHVGFDVTDTMREKTAGGVPMFSRKEGDPDQPADDGAVEREKRVRLAEEDYRLPNIGNAVPKEYVPPQARLKEVTIYRGVPSSRTDATIRPGDWVTLNRAYASQHGSGETGATRVLSMKVPADHVAWAGTDMNEWFYAPRDNEPKFSAKSEEERRQSHGFHTREIQVDGKWRPIEDSSGRLLARGDFRGQQNLWRFLADSKAVDSNGRPLVLFHGTKQDISEFTPSRGGEYGSGIYLTEDPNTAGMFAGRAHGDGGENVMPVYARMTNPYIAATRDEVRALGPTKLKAQGYDGIIGTSATGEKQYVVFDPTQVKSAMGGVGTYDGSNPDIRFARKGSTTATANLPASAPLGTWERSKSVVSDLIDEGLTKSGVYKFTSPMSEGSTRAKAMAQNFANAERQARREWQRVQEVIAKDFPDKTVREKMWNAADQENEILSGRLAPSASVGLASLTPRQRDVVEQLHAYGEELLQRAKDVGMFSGDGVPYWTPRMMVMLDANGEYTRPVEPGKKETSGGDGRNVFVSSSNLKQRKYLTSAETEAAMQAKGGELVRDITTMPMAMQRLERAIAGRELINQVKDLGRATGTATVSNSMHEGFFTLDHAAFTRFQPRMEKDPVTGKSVPMQDSHGNIILDRVPLYMSKEFEGPIKAILSNTDGTAYRAYMLLKSKAMSAIMFSPMIHNLVIMGRAVGYSTTGTLSLKLYRDGYKARQDDALMREALAGGMVPMGHNNAGMIDVTDVARGIGREGGWGDPNESWVALGAKTILGAVNKDAGAAAKRFIDKAGDFWHGTLLWNRVGDLQVGIFKHAYESLQAKGFEPEVARVMAAHWANRYAGAVARENMGEYARKLANVMLFSRSFNIGNVGAVKDMLYGMPSGLRAKIEYEQGHAAASAAFTEARKKAWAGFIKDATLSLLALSLAQSAVDKLKKDKGWDEIFAGYAERAGEMGEEIKNHPFNPKSYSPWQLSPTHGHEPGKQDRVDFGEIPGAGGRHEYMRLPTGKVVEDTINWTTHLGDTFHSKMSPLAKAAWEATVNDKGFGVPVWDPTATGAAFISDFSLNTIKHLVKAQTPWDTIVTVWDRLHNKTTEVENDKMVGNVTGFGFSQGHPQGPDAGIAAKVEDDVKARKAMAMEEVKRLLRYDDEEKARQKLEDAGLAPREVNSIIKRIENPREGMSPSQRRRFNQHSTEEDQRKMDRVTR